MGGKKNCGEHLGWSVTHLMVYHGKKVCQAVPSIRNHNFGFPKQKLLKTEVFGLKTCCWAGPDYFDSWLQFCDSNLVLWLQTCDSGSVTSGLWLFCFHFDSSPMTHDSGSVTLWLQLCDFITPIQSPKLPKVRCRHEDYFVFKFLFQLDFEY